MDISTALNRHVAQLQADGRSPHTVGQHRRHVEAFARWLASENRSIEVDEIDHEDVAAFLNSPAARDRVDGQPKTPTAMNALRGNLRSYFRFAHEAGYARTNAGRLIRRARCSPPPPRALSDLERDRLLCALALDATPEGKRDRVLVSLMLHTGIRLGDALRLEREDVDLEGGELRLRRSKNSREEIVVLPATERMLESRLWIAERTGVLFVGRDGKPLSARHVQRRLREWAERAGISKRITPHMLRHTFAQGLYNRTGDLALVQSALNHRSIVSTLVYARCDRERLKAVLG